MDFHPPDENARQSRRVAATLSTRPIAAAVKRCNRREPRQLRAWMPGRSRRRPTIRDGLPRASRSSSFGGDVAANYAITLWDFGEYVGGCGLMPRVGPAALEIGYWVHAAIPPPRHRDGGRAPAHQRRARDSGRSKRRNPLRCRQCRERERRANPRASGLDRSRAGTHSIHRPRPVTRWSGSANDRSDSACQVILIPARSGGSGYFGSISVSVSMSNRLTAQLRNHL